MDYSISCDCGTELTVSEWSAGSRIQCECGRTVVVPSSAQLRASAGLAPVEIPLNIEVARLLDSGDIPPPTCVNCGSDSSRVIDFVADCEQLHVKESGGVSVSIGHFRMEEEHVTELHGRDTIIPIPASVCNNCQKTWLRPPLTSPLMTVTSALGIAGSFALFFIHWAIALVAIICGFVLWRAMSNNSLNRYQESIKQGLSNIPVYKKVFERFPDTVVVIASDEPPSQSDAG